MGPNGPSAVTVKVCACGPLSLIRLKPWPSGQLRMRPGPRDPMPSGEKCLSCLYTFPEFVDRGQRRLDFEALVPCEGGPTVADNQIQQCPVASSPRTSAHTYGWAASMRSCCWILVCSSAARAARFAARVD